MSKSIVDEFENLVSAFKHCGWVNGLSQEQYDALNKAEEYVYGLKKKDNSEADMAKKLRDNGYTIREIMVIMGYNHPGSVSHLLSKQQP